jgi:lipopolysaccharide biosynthesis glycosyltransferase
VFEQDLSDIFKLDLCDKYLAAIKAVTKYNIKYKNGELIYRPNYFYAGLLVMDLEKIRNDGKVQELKEYMNCGHSFSGNDNDILNIVFNEDVVYLHPKYCFIPHLKRELLKLPMWHKAYGKKECIESVKTPAIIHYASKYKPWLTKKMAYKKEWMDYYKKSIFNDIPLTYRYEKECYSKKQRAWRHFIRRIKALLIGC